METKKKTFKIVLDSYNTNSYYGEQFNSNFYVDLTKILQKDEDFDKSYLCYVTFKTRSESIANNNITSTNIYSLCLKFNNLGLNNYQYDMFKNYDYLLDVNNVTDTGGTIHTFLKLDDNKQHPILLNNIRNLNNINLQVYQNNTTSESIFTPAIPDNSKFICILTLVET